MRTLEKLIKEESNGIEGATNMEEEIITPYELKQKYPLDNGAEKTILEARRVISRILTGKDDRFLILTGPCSIDDYDAALEYGSKLKGFSEEVNDKAVLVMRTYFEKPRTNIGWKGKATDSDGLEFSRELLIELAKRGTPTATEFLSPFVHPYISDAISYGAIGARNSQSQTNWEFASDLPIPIGIKNSTDGKIENAINGVIAINNQHTFFGINDHAKTVLKKSHGNKYAHVILRGGYTGPNYSEEHIKKTIELLEKNNLLKAILIDCSHANSQKDYTKQPEVARDVFKQGLTNPYIKGIMLESYLFDGKGNANGQSKTDACLGWDKTEALIREIYERI